MALITITCTMGSGGRIIAQKVAEGLGLEVFDDVKFQEAALQAGISPEDRANLDERAPGLWGHIWRQKSDMYINLMESVRGVPGVKDIRAEVSVVPAQYY